MLSKLEVTTQQGSLLSLPLEDISEGLMIEEIEGLDPVKASIVTSSFARMDGEQYHSSWREKRNIKIALGLIPDETEEAVADVRKRAYGYFMPKSLVKLRFFDEDGTAVDIEGRVESCEAPLWSEEPSLVVSILCFDPDFASTEETQFAGLTTSGTDDYVIEYDGSVETGVYFSLFADRDIDEFTIYHTTPGGVLQQLDFAAEILSGETLHISTVAGDKYAQLATPNQGVASILRGVSPQAKWIELEPGTNQLRVYATGAAIPWEITYRHKYGGL